MYGGGPGGLLLLLVGAALPLLLLLMATPPTGLFLTAARGWIGEALGEMPTQEQEQYSSNKQQRLCVTRQNRM